MFYHISSSIIILLITILLNKFEALFFTSTKHRMMTGCKARKCIRNTKLNHTLKGCNDFKMCNKKVYQDGFCKRCYESDKRVNNENWIPDQLWKRDGIYGEPYDFPYHKNEKEKDWVEKIYILHPNIRPQEDQLEDQLEEDYEQRQQAVKDWLDKYSTKINYKMGKELEKIINN